MLTSTEDVWWKISLELTQQLRDARITVSTSSFNSGRSLLKTSVFSKIKLSGFRVIILLSSEGDTKEVATNAFREGMTYGWAWILMEPTTEIDVMHGWLCLRTHLPSEGMQTFAEQVKDYTKSHFCFTADHTNTTHLPLHDAVALHDAIMLYAHAVTKLLIEGQNLHRDAQSVTEVVWNTTFMGVGGHVALNPHSGDRIESYDVMNYVKRAGGGMKSMLVGTYNRTEQYTVYAQVVVWPGSSANTPLDRGALMAPALPAAPPPHTHTPRCHCHHHRSPHSCFRANTTVLELIP